MICTAYKAMHSLQISEWIALRPLFKRIKSSVLFVYHCVGISYRDHMTNEEVKARIGNAIGPYEDFLTSVKDAS